MFMVATDATNCAICGCLVIPSGCVGGCLPGMAVECSWPNCLARRGALCTYKNGRPMPYCHSRREKAERVSRAGSQGAGK